MDELKEFFAVTCRSVWRVAASGEEDCPYLEKIAGQKESDYPVGTVFKEGTMLAVANYLQLYYPEVHSMLSPQSKHERRLEYVNTAWWRAHTSRIVALFLDKEKALACFGQQDLNPCDSRWIEETKEVLGSIGEDHSRVTICHYRDYALLPAH